MPSSLILLLPAKIMTGLKDFTKPGAPQMPQDEDLGMLRSIRPRHQSKPAEKADEDQIEQS